MTEQEFDTAMAAAKLEKQRALKVASVNRAHGYRVTEFNIQRINRAQEAIDALKCHPVFIERSRLRAEEKKSIKAAGNKRYRQSHPEKVRDSARRSRQKRRENGLEAEYRRRPEVRHRIKQQKTQLRRAAGVPSREELAQRAAEKAAVANARRLAKANFIANFIGPPKPRAAMTESEYYAWRVRTDPDFYAKELDRAQRYKARTRPGYKDPIVKWAETPPAVKQVKHLQYLISRQIDRSEHENHQRAA